jgi:hypothetical protein
MVEVQICEVSLAQQWFKFLGIVGFPWLHHMPSSAEVTIGTKACNLLNTVKLINYNEMK